MPPHLAARGGGESADFALESKLRAVGSRSGALESRIRPVCSRLNALESKCGG